MHECPDTTKNQEEDSDVKAALPHEPVSLQYAVKGRRRDMSVPQDRGVVRVFMFVLMAALLVPVVLAVAAIVGALLIY